MDWHAIGTYRETVIWVRERATGCWVAALVPVALSGVKGPALISPSEERALPLECESQTAAVEAAMQYLDRGQRRGVRPGGTSRSMAGTQEAGPKAEVRRFERIPISLQATCQAPQFPGMEIRGMVRYIAAGGLMVELPVEVVSGSTMRVHLQTREGSREVEGKVVWTAVNRNRIRHGLSFPEPQGPDFLEECLNKDGP
jgi:hypothetical protein